MCIGSYSASCPGLNIPLAQQKLFQTNAAWNWSDSPGSNDIGPYPLVSTANVGCTLGSTCKPDKGCLNRNIAARGADHTSGTGSDESIYLKLKVPGTQASGAYVGQITLSYSASATDCDGGYGY